MSHTFSRFADGLLARFVPALRAHASTCVTVNRFCYCQGPFRYERQCLVCDGVARCKACEATMHYCLPR